MKQYFHMLELEYNNPPKNVAALLKNTLDNTDNTIINYKNKSFVTVIRIAKDIFIIHELITRMEFRNTGYATKLMKKVHKRFKGIFITRTQIARGFYESLGYKYIGNKTLCFINKDLFGRKYWR